MQAQKLGLALGLSTSVFFAQGKLALAVTAENQPAMIDYVAPFGMGFAAGAVAAGAVCAVLIAWENRRDEEEFDFREYKQAQSADAKAPQVAPTPAAKVVELSVAPAKALDLNSRLPLVEPQDEIVQLAQNYVKKQSLSERLSTQMKGVRAVLAERLSQDHFDDLPIIQRADGSVGDVGTQWWTTRFSDAIKSAEPFEHDGQTAAQKPVAAPQVAAAPAEKSYTAHVPASIAISGTSANLAAQETYQVQNLTQPSAGPSARAARASLIRSRIAEVNQGIYPEKRSADELDNADLWLRAMDSISEKISANTPSPLVEKLDVIGGEIDEIEGLENDTAFLHFRTPAGHPEVQDKASYIDYLIKDEMSKNTNQSLRRSSRRYFKLVEGKSQTNLTVIKSAQPSYRPKHLKPTPQLSAKEA